jgi:hypothetical protein
MLHTQARVFWLSIAARSSVDTFPSLTNMLNLRTIPLRAFPRFRTPLSSTIFRKQPYLPLQAHELSPGRVERRTASASSSAYHINPPAPSGPPSKSWVEYTPERIRPYLYLARVDKPIGTLLLYYPCSASPSPEIGIRNRDGQGWW